MEANTTVRCVKRVLKGGRDRGSGIGCRPRDLSCPARFRERPAWNAGMAADKALRKKPRGRRLSGDGCTGNESGA